MTGFRPTAFTTTVLARLEKLAESAHLYFRLDEEAETIVLANREICITVQMNHATIQEEIYDEGRKRCYIINWSGTNELDIHDHYFCYKAPWFIGIWDYQYEEEEEA